MLCTKIPNSMVVAAEVRVYVSLIVFHCSSDYVCISPLCMVLVVFIGVFYSPFRYHELYCILD